jgi:GNAT superfamily N-acetyltransferase
MLIRPAVHADLPAICRVHQAAARQLAAKAYSPEQIEAWVGGLTPASYAKVMTTHALFVAEDERGVIGFGQLDPARAEVDAVYVAPEAAGRGVGTALLLALEQTARNCGAMALHLMATINAVPFYTRAGYVWECDALYQARFGVALPVVSMCKRLRPQTPAEPARPAP